MFKLTLQLSTDGSGVGASVAEAADFAAQPKPVCH
jgi:hypothetical protein